MRKTLWFLGIILMVLLASCQSSKYNNYIEPQKTSELVLADESPKCSVETRTDTAFGGSSKCIDKEGFLETPNYECKPDGRGNIGGAELMDVYGHILYCEEEKCQKNTRLSSDCSKFGASYSCGHESLEAFRCIDVCTGAGLLANFDTVAECHAWFESR